MFKLALRNVTRHTLRTTAALAAIAFGVIALILTGGFVQDLFSQLGEAVIHSQSGHLQIAKAGFQAEGTRRPELYLLQNPEELKSRLASLSGVADVMARVTFSGLINNGRSDLAVIGEGIESDKEARLGSYMRITAGRGLTDRDRNGIMLGEGIARASRLSPGDAATLITTTLDGAMNTLDVRVIGVFQTFSKDYDARAVKVPLAAARDALGTKDVNSIVVSLSDTRATLSIANLLRPRLLNEGLEVWTWQELNDFYAKTVKLYETQFGALQLIILIMVLVGVANSVNMSVFERVSEFGTMRALGNPSRTIFMLVVMESWLIGIAGSSIGVAIGIALAHAISVIGIPMPPPPNADLGYTAKIEVIPFVIFGAFVVGMIAAVLAGFIAAMRVSRVSVV